MPTTNLLYRLSKLGKKTQFCRLSCPYCLLDYVYLQLPTMADTHSQLPTTPCDIRLVFGNDARHAISWL